MADNKHVVRKYGGYGAEADGSYVAFDSRYPGNYTPNNNLGDSVGASKAAGVLNRQNKGNTVSSNNIGVWRGVTPGYASNTHGQKAIQGLQELMNMPQGSDVVIYDTEILGTTPFHRKGAANADFYTPTEIGFQHAKMINGKLEVQSKSLSMLLKPNEQVYTRLNDAISNLESKKWTGLTEDMRRTLSDLTLYAGDTSKMFSEQYKDGRRIISVQEQSRHLRPMNGTDLSGSDTIANMRRGLENLMQWGTNPEDAILEMNSFMTGFQNTRFAGYNVYSFDQPMMLDYLNNGVGKMNPNSPANKALQTLKDQMALNQIDGLHAVRTLYRDPYERYGDRVTLERQKEVLIASNPSRYAHLETGQSHHALSDVNTTIAQLNMLLQDPHTAHVLRTGNRPGSTFAYFNDETLKVGDRLFGVAGMNSNNAGAYDGIYRMKNGKLHSAYDMKPNPIYRNTSYTIKNFFDGINIDGKKMYGIHLFNEDDGLHHTIFRESEGELQSAIHQHLQYVGPAGTPISQAHGALHAGQNDDRAMRRWNKMFSTESGGGIQLATRMYGALDEVQSIETRTKRLTDPALLRKDNKGMTRTEAEATAAKNKRIVAKMKKRAVLRQSSFNTDEFYRDFEQMRGRLEGEKDWIKGAIDRINTAMPVSKPDDYGTFRAQSMVLAEFGKKMDDKFGINSAERHLHGGKALSLDIAGEHSYLNLTNADNVRGALYGQLYKGNYSRPDLSIIKQRYKQLLLQLKSYNALEAKKFEDMWYALDNREYDQDASKLVRKAEGVRKDVSLDTMLTDISNAIIRAKETNSLHGALNGVTVENPTKVEDARAAAMKKADFSSTLDSMFTSSLSDVQPYTSKIREGAMELFGNDAMNLVDSHDKAIAMLMQRNGLIGKDGKQIATGLDLQHIKSSRSSLAELAQAFHSQDMHVQIRYDGKRKGLQMVLADKGVSESLLNGSIHDIMKSNQAAVIDLPRLMKDGSLTLGGQNRVARFKANRKFDGTYELVTGFDEIVNTLKYNAGTVRTMLDDAKKMSPREGRDNGMIMVHDYLNRKAKKAMMNLSMNNRYSIMSGHDNPWETKSQAANWVRGGLIDISDTAEDWYTQFYNETSVSNPNRIDLWGLKTPEKVKELAAKNGELFVDSMGMQARRVFQRQSDEWWNEKTGMNVGMHSVKDVHVSNYLRANLDARELLAFGFYNPMGRENIMKTVNYNALDKDKVRYNLKKQGYGDKEIDRMMSRGVVSEGALDVMEEYSPEANKISYLNMRAAYMNDQQLAERLTKGGIADKWATIYEARAKEKGRTQAEIDKYMGYVKRLRGLESISTYDGMFLMSEKAASAYGHTREKKIKLGPGEELTDEIKRLIMNQHKDGENVDFTKNITMDDWRKQDNGLIKNPKLLTNYGTVDTSHSYKNNEKSLTVSNVVQEDLVRDAQGNVVYDGLNPRTEKKPVRVGKTYDKWYAQGTWIKGWDAENQELILEEQVHSMNSTKYITEAGHRATATLLPEEVIRDLAGDKNVKAIMPQFEVSKGMFGSEISRMVGMAVDEAKRQIDAGGHLTAGKIAKEDALQTINQIMQDSFGIGSSLSYIKDGQIVVNRHLGGKDAEMAYTAENMNKFANAMDKYLGTDTFSGKTLDHASGVTHYGNLGIGKQDVYDWENGVGLVDENSSGLVRYGRKEVDMITERVNQVLGRGSAVTGWLKEHIDLASKAQSKDMAQIGRGLIKSSVYLNPVTPDSGDVVIRTSGNSFDADDPNGVRTGRITDKGVREISMHALNDVPTVTAKDTVRTAEMYAQTIIDFGRAQGSFKDGVSFSKAIKNAGGTALLELPNSDAINRKYLRLVDFGDITKGDTAVIPVMRELQTIQQQLWRNIQEYNGMNSNGKLSESESNDLRERLETRINDLSDQYEDKAARMVSNSRDGGLSKTLGAAKMDNAGRFRIQGVNPFANYEEVAGAGFVQPKNAQYQEGSMYVSRNRLQEMIGDAKGYANDTTMNIAKAMGLEEQITKKAWNLSEHGEQIMKLVLDNVNDKGLYGFVNRYPTIKQSTVQSMRIQIDDSIDPADRTGRLTVGTAARLKADYDGDFMSAVLSHYSTDTNRATIIHNELKSINSVESREAHKEGSRVLQELHEDMNNTAKSMNITVGELAKQVNEAEMVRQNMRNGVEGANLSKDQKTLLMKFGRDAADKGIMSKYMNPEDILETREARLGKEFVGLIDNARDRIVNLASATLDELEAHGKINIPNGSPFKTAGADMRNAIEKFGAAFSQDSISAKKFSVEDEIKRQFDLSQGTPQQLDFHNEAHMAEARSRAIKAVDERYNKLQDMIEAVMNPTNENKQKFMDHNVELQLFKGPEGEADMKKSLNAIQKVAIWNNRTGSFFNNSLKLSQSLGQEQSRLAGIMMGTDNHVANTQAIQNLIEWSKNEDGTDSEITTNLRDSRSRWSKSLLNTFERVENGGDDALRESLGRGFDPNSFSLSGSTVAEDTKGGLMNMIGKFAPKLEMGGGAGKGALAFGAMWAASALIRSGPTPEGLQKQTQGPSAPAAPPMDTNPTARITKNNGEYVNIQINAKNAKNMSEQDIAAAVHQELGAMTNTKLDTNINVNDNTQNIDPNWLQGVVAKAIGGGYAF